jgi:hypothetical protein
MRRFRAFSFLAAIVLTAAVVGPATVVANDDNDGRLQARPWTFVGKAGDCGPGYPAGSRIVTAAWLGGMGLPDADGDTALNGVPGTRNDPHLGLLLNKNGPTPDCSSSGATIKGVKGMVVDAAFALGYDYRNGGHCGAGAPRFNVDTNNGFFFVGCANAPKSNAPQDPAQWTRARSTLVTCGVECFPTAIPAGSRIKSINIVFDEGTDTANNDTEGVGLAVIDNIFVNGEYIRRGAGISTGGGAKGKNGDDDDD